VDGGNCVPNWLDFPKPEVGGTQGYLKSDEVDTVASNDVHGSYLKVTFNRKYDPGARQLPL
jgi:hypothetical protein